MRRALVLATAGLVLLGGSPAAAQEEPRIALSDWPVSAHGPNELVTPIEGISTGSIDGERGVSAAMPKGLAAMEPPAPPSPPPAPAVTLLLKADLATQTVTVMQGEVVVHVWPISSGRRGYATPTGTFRPAWMAKMWRSRQYDDAPMPHSIFFNRGVAFHATSAVSMLGRPASHGCLRLAPAHAAELYALVRKHGLIHTKVVVEGAAPFPPTAVAGRAPAQRKREAALIRQQRQGAAGASGQLLFAAQWLFMQ